MGWQDAPVVDAAAQSRWSAAPKVSGATQTGGGAPAPAAPAAPSPALPAQPSPDQGGALGFIGGNLGKGVANLVGMPVDAITQALNLGIAGAGAITSGLPGKPPDLIENPPGGSQWFQGLLQRGGMIPPSAEPQSTGGRYGAAALQMAPGAMIGRPTPAQLPRALTATTSSAVGGELARDIGGDEWAPVGAMLPGAGKMQHQSAGERATAQRKAEAFGKAREMGVPVPPSALKPDKAQQAIQDTGNRALRQPEGTEFSPQNLQAYRNAHYADYEAIIKSPALAKGVVPNPRFQQEIQSIGQEIDQARGSLPETFKGMRPVLKLLGEYGYAAVPGGGKGVKIPPRQQPIPPDVAMRAVKKLRSDATANYASDKPEKIELARVQKRIANSLEQLMEDNLQDPAAMQRFREARTAIAKSHDYEAAMEPGGRINAQKLAQMQNEGAPLSGGTRDIAQVAGAFPQSVGQPKADETFTRRVSPMAITHPAAVAAHQVPRLWDRMQMNPIGQAMADPRGYLSPEQQQLIRYLAAQQSTRGVPQPPE